MRKHFLLLAVAAAAAVLLAACGGDDEAPITTLELGPTGPTGPTGALARSDLIKDGDDICAEAYTALANLPADETGAGGQAAQQASIVEGLADSLDSLGQPPREDRDAYEEFLDGLQDAARAYEQGDAVTAEAELADARQAASDYGFKDCGEEGEALGGAGGATTTPSTTPAAPTTPAPTTTAPTAPPSGGTGTTPAGGGGGTGGTGGVSP